MVIDPTSRNATYIIVKGRHNCSWSLAKNDLNRRENNVRFNQEKKITPINQTIKSQAEERKCPEINSAKEIAVILVGCLLGVIVATGIVVCAINARHHRKRKSFDRVRNASNKILNSKPENPQEFRRLESISVDNNSPATINLRQEKEHQSVQENWLFAEVSQSENNTIVT